MKRTRTVWGAMNRRSLLTVHLPLLLAMMFWGTNFVSIKRLLGTMSVLDVLVVRAIIASALYGVTLVVIRRTNRRVERGDIPRLLVVALLSGIGNQLPIVVAQRYIGASISSLLVTTNPLWTALFAWLLLGVRVTRRQAVGMGVAFTGFVIILLLGGLDVSFSVRNMAGVLIFILGPLSFGLYSVVAKPLLGRYPATEIVAITSIAGGVFLLPILATGTGERLTRLSRVDWLVLLWMSGVVMWLGYIIFFRGLKLMEPSQVAVYAYLIPCFGVIAGSLFLREPLTVFVLLGGVTILVGVGITNTASRRARPPARAPVAVAAAPSGDG